MPDPRAGPADRTITQPASLDLAPIVSVTYVVS